MQNHRAILLNVPTDLLERLNEASTAMDVSRSEFIRRALTRDVEFVLEHEVFLVSRAKEQTKLDFTQWLKESGIFVEE